MQIIASQGLQHSFHRSLATGVLLRAGLITAIYRRSLRLTARARSLLPNGKIVNHISTGGHIPIISCQHWMVYYMFPSMNLYRCFSHRLLLWLLPFRLDGTYPDDYLPHPATAEFGSVGACGICLIRRRNASDDQGHGSTYEGSQEQHVMDR